VSMLSMDVLEYFEVNGFFGMDITMKIAWIVLGNRGFIFYFIPRKFPFALPISTDWAIFDS